MALHRRRDSYGFLPSEAPIKISQTALTFAERVAYQRAIEDVYWRHRIWPKENARQADTGCGDVSGAAGKQSRRLSSRVAGTRELLAKSDYC